MRASFTPAREKYLLVDGETGVVLSDGPELTISRRNIEAHPFIEAKAEPGIERVFAGPDARAAAAGHRSQDNFREYEVIRDVAGFVTLRRLS